MSGSSGRAVLTWLRRLQVMTQKELLQQSRDVVLMLFILYAFTMDIYWAGSGVSLQLNNAAVAVADDDRSFASRELIHRFTSPRFLVKGEAAHPDVATRLLDSGEAMVVLSIPPDFQRDILRGESTSVQMQIDTTNSVLGEFASSYAAQIVGRYGLEAGLARMGMTQDSLSHAPGIVDDRRAWFNPNQEDAWFMAISELLTIVTVFAILLPAAAMVREKERGTIEQLLVSPLSPFQIMFSKIVAMTGVILAGSALSVFAVIEGVFHVPMKGSYVAFFAVTCLYVFTTSGLGLFAATIAKNLAQAGMMTILILAPMLFLSGAWTPPEAMPEWLRIGMFLSPLHYYIDAAYGIFLKGMTLAELWRSLLGLVVLGSVVFGFGMWRFRRQFR